VGSIGAGRLVLNMHAEEMGDPTRRRRRAGERCGAMRSDGGAGDRGGQDGRGQRHDRDARGA
jgi:hypothetical protein